MDFEFSHWIWSNCLHRHWDEWEEYKCSPCLDVTQCVVCFFYQMQHIVGIKYSVSGGSLNDCCGYANHHSIRSWSALASASSSPTKHYTHCTLAKLMSDDACYVSKYLHNNILRSIIQQKQCVCMLLIDDVLCSMPHINTQLIGAQNIKMMFSCLRYIVVVVFCINIHSTLTQHNKIYHVKHVQHMPYPCSLEANGQSNHTSKWFIIIIR